MTDFVFFLECILIAGVFLAIGYAISWYICGVIYNFSPRFRRWFKRNCK